MKASTGFFEVELATNLWYLRVRTISSPSTTSRRHFGNSRMRFDCPANYFARQSIPELSECQSTFNAETQDTTTRSPDEPISKCSRAALSYKHMIDGKILYSRAL